MGFRASNFLLLLLLLNIFSASLVLACDPCALNNVIRNTADKDNQLVVGVQEQYTNFRKGNGNEFYSLKNGEIIRGFSTTQIGALYGLNKNLSLSLNLPYIVRYLDKVSNYRKETTSDAGIGDMSVLASYSDHLIDKADFKFSYAVFSGLKLPTGDTGSVSEVVESPRKHHVISGLGGSAGRLFAFGTGSVDVPVGIDAQLLYGRIYFPNYLQYNFRNEGAHHYRFNNDLSYSLAPGYLLLLDDAYTFSTHALIYGENKGADTVRGMRQSSSSYSNLYVGPSFNLSLDSGFNGDIAVMFRTTAEDNSIVAPDMRIKFGISKRF